MAPLGDGAGLEYPLDVEIVGAGGMAEDSAIVVVERQGHMGTDFASAVHLEVMMLI